METYWRWMAKATCRVRRVLAREDGQGTTEYAILVGSAGGDRHHRDHRVPTEAARAVGQHRRRDQRAVEEKGGAVIRAGSFNECGQGTVEFALVTAAFLAAVIALGALWRGLEAGMFVDHALMSASHHIQMTMPGSVADVFLY